MIVHRGTVAFAVLWAASTILLFAGQESTNRNTSHLAATQHQLVVDLRRQTQAEHVALAAQVNACKRLNVQRALVNRESYANWKLWNLFLNLVVHPVVRPAPEGPAQREARRKFLIDNRGILRSLQWVPLTDCAASVTAAGFPTYGPRNFSAKRPPPHADLYP